MHVNDQAAEHKHLSVKVLKRVSSSYENKNTDIRGTQPVLSLK